jgi:hypothetical protein
MDIIKIFEYLIEKGDNSDISDFYYLRNIIDVTDTYFKITDYEDYVIVHSNKCLIKTTGKFEKIFNKKTIKEDYNYIEILKLFLEKHFMLKFYCKDVKLLAEKIRSDIREFNINSVLD